MSAVLLPALVIAAAASAAAKPAETFSPDWASDAIWYQIFPERFRNGDPSNDPTAISLEEGNRPPPGWRITPWTREWYARDTWETDLGPNFFDHGVFSRRYGGDLQGVIDKLDYLRELGINAIYFNPVFHARSLHKYDGSSFHHIDPFFGPDPEGDLRIMEQETADPQTWQWTAADRLFLKLLQEARARGIRVIIDGVFNHTGRDFFAFRDIRANQARSRYKDWYVVTGFDDPETRRNEFDYEGWWGFKSLPIFANTPDGQNLHPEPKRYIFDSTRRWMDPNGDGDPSDGVDGWRLDVAEEVPAGFWRDWHALVRSINPEAYTTAEIWSPSAHYLAEADFGSAMNYDGFAIPLKRFLIDDSIDAKTFAEQIDKARLSHTPGNSLGLQNLFDSHDTDRIASMVVNGFQRARFGLPRTNYDQQNGPRSSEDFLLRKPEPAERTLQRTLVLFQVSYVGAPMFYYGTEAGMWGADDPCDRMPMPWPDLAMEPQTLGPKGPDGREDDTNFDPVIFQFHQAAIAVRSDWAALRRGDYRTLHAPAGANSFAFLRNLGGEAVICAVNRSEDAVSITVPAADLPANLPASWSVLIDSTDTGDGQPARIEMTPAGLVLHIPPLSGVLAGAR